MNSLTFGKKPWILLWRYMGSPNTFPEKNYTASQIKCVELQFLSLPILPKDIPGTVKKNFSNF